VDDPDRLVVKAPSWVLNPALTGRLEREKRLDPRRFAREYGAEFADVLAEALLKAEDVQAVTMQGIAELPPDRSQIACAHLDISTGIGNDAAGFAIAAPDGRRSVLRLVRHWRPPFDVSVILAEVAGLCRRYEVPTLTIDKYAPGLTQALLQQHGIVAQLAEQDTSRAFLSLLMLINARACNLLDHEALTRELVGLVRAPSAGGRDVVGHGRSGHDDLAAAVAQALTQAAHVGATSELGLIGGQQYEAQQQQQARPEVLNLTDAEFLAMPQGERDLYEWSEVPDANRQADLTARS
jgi:hypothetical protein